MCRRRVRAAEGVVFLLHQAGTALAGGREGGTLIGGQWSVRAGRATTQASGDASRGCIEGGGVRVMVVGLEGGQVRLVRQAALTGISVGHVSLPEVAGEDDG